MKESRRERLLRKAEKAEKNAREYEAHMGALGWSFLIPPALPITIPVMLLFSTLSDKESKRAERLRKKANK
ncbi:hypothetical protein [Shimazuella kribbensis]|uniref:hypothetical protein n=1 Tax=Shimazuella kribbensis TaxID=139808 RepID=UPI00048AE4F7|nr:hypothetical protein [Shimazuella kribbensis]